MFHSLTTLTVSLLFTSLQTRETLSSVLMVLYMCTCCLVFSMPLFMTEYRDTHVIGLEAELVNETIRAAQLKQLLQL
jgi:hypothetical protein